MTIDIDALREDLLSYFGTAVASGYSTAMMDVIRIKDASADELVEIAIDNGFDMIKYII